MPRPSFAAADIQIDFLGSTVVPESHMLLQLGPGPGLAPLVAEPS